MLGVVILSPEEREERHKSLELQVEAQEIEIAELKEKLDLLMKYCGYVTEDQALIYETCKSKGITGVTATFCFLLVAAGLRKLESVPQKYRAKVQAMINE